MLKRIGKRFLVRICTSVVALAIAGVIFLVEMNTGTNKIGRLLNNDYYDNYMSYFHYLADFDMENAEKSLAKCIKAIDKIDAVSVSDQTIEHKIDLLAADEKTYLNDVFRCFSILNDPDNASEEELDWALEYIESPDNSQDDFYKEVYKLVS